MVHARDAALWGGWWSRQPRRFNRNTGRWSELFDRWLVASRDAVLSKRDRGYQFEGRTLDEYGMLNFGDAVHKIIDGHQAARLRHPLGDRVLRFSARAVPALFPHWRSWYRCAPPVEGAAHLADVDISHYDVQPTLHGAPRTGPA